MSGSHLERLFGEDDPMLAFHPRSVVDEMLGTALLTEHSESSQVIRKQSLPIFIRFQYQEILESNSSTSITSQRSRGSPYFYIAFLVGADGPCEDQL